MKNIIIVIIIIILLVLGILGFVIFDNRESNVSNIEYFRFFYTRGYAYHADVTYELDCYNKCQAVVVPYGVGDEDAIVKNVDKEFVDRLLEIINKYNVDRWDGFNGTNKDVLDGDSFSLSIKTREKKYISATGYMSWPKNYGSFKAEVDALFEELM